MKRYTKSKVCRPGFHNSRYISQWIEGLKSSYVVCKAKWSRIESLLSCKHFSGDSSLFCLMLQCHIVICHHSTMTLEHMQRIWGWLHLEKCFFIPHELADKENACTSEFFHVSLILNEFTVTPLWYLWNNTYNYKSSSIFSPFFFLYQNDLNKGCCCCCCCCCYWAIFLEKGDLFHVIHIILPILRQFRAFGTHQGLIKTWIKKLLVCFLFYINYLVLLSFS